MGKSVLLVETRHVGEECRILRLARRMSQHELAVRASDYMRDAGYHVLRVSPGEVSVFERSGRLTRPKRLAILAILGVADGE